MPVQLRLIEGDPLEVAVGDASSRLASGLVYRIEHLAEREQRVRKHAGWETLPNMPARLIWEAFEPDAAAHFVVYKLMHEARSVLPKIYRAIAWNLCSVQPKRFGMVTYREQLWSLLASVDCWPEDVSCLSEQDLQAFVLQGLMATSAINWFCHREEDLVSDSHWIAKKLCKQTGIAGGMYLLRRVQLSQQTAITAGNVILHIPAALENMAGTICSQAKEGQLPPFEAIERRVATLGDAFAEDRNWGICTNISVPFDLLTLDDKDHLSILAMTRYGSDRAEQEDLRRRLIYLRFFAHYAFGRRKPQNLTIAAAFYADQQDQHEQWLPTDKPLFHSEEIWSFDRFWNFIAGRDGGGELVERVTAGAADTLKKMDLAAKLRAFVAGEK